MKKTLLCAIAVLLLASAASLQANTDWYGKFWGDAEGEWKGTIYDKEKPFHFEGVWGDGHQDGTAYAELAYEGSWLYKIVKGTLYNSEGDVIGGFDGYFDANIKPGYAEGNWWLEFINVKGSWQGQRSW